LRQTQSGCPGGGILPLASPWMLLVCSKLLMMRQQFSTHTSLSRGACTSISFGFCQTIQPSPIYTSPPPSSLSPVIHPQSGSVCQTVYSSPRDHMARHTVFQSTLLQCMRHCPVYKLVYDWKGHRCPPGLLIYNIHFSVASSHSYKNTAMYGPSDLPI